MVVSNILSATKKIISLDLMSAYIKYFKNGGKNMKMWKKKLWLKMIVNLLNIIKIETKLKTLSIKFHCMSVDDENYIKY